MRNLNPFEQIFVSGGDNAAIGITACTGAVGLGVPMGAYTPVATTVLVGGLPATGAAAMPGVAALPAIPVVGACLLAAGGGYLIGEALVQSPAGPTLTTIADVLTLGVSHPIGWALAAWDGWN